MGTKRRTQFVVENTEKSEVAIRRLAALRQAWLNGYEAGRAGSSRDPDAGDFTMTLERRMKVEGRSNERDPRGEPDPQTLPEIDVFYHSSSLHWDDPRECGWYWESCIPGCLPDDDPFGPFETEVEALADARLRGR